ncbi:MAG: hypothetical protein IKJ63_03725 [Clostridia bacterium]|nr:hypothetical protein [Clostridia bacterium]
MKTRKLISLLLALMMFVSVVPFYASAATKITLTVANVTEWPTAVGEMYVGQIVGEHITITGGEVRYDADGDGVLEDAEIVPGHFEHFNATLSISLASDASKANIKFVPDDSTAYSGFNKLMSTDVTYVVKKTTAVLMDESNPPVATPIKEGQTLSESIISGGTMKNPYNEKLNLSSKVWSWVEPTQVITESGEYLAKWEGDTRAYEAVTDYIYVEVEKDQKATALKTMPVVNFDYNPNLTWESYDFVDATAVVVNSDTYVSGTFSVVESMINTVPRAGSYEIEVAFTPDDTDNYVGFTVSVPVTVNALPISFGEDYKGTTIDEPFEYEVAPGTMMRDILSYIKGGLLNYPTSSVTKIEDANSKAENGKVYKVTVLNYTNTNYTGSEAYIKTVFKDVEFTPTVKRSTGSGLNKFFIDCGDYRPEGTFTVYCNGEEIAEVKAGYSFDCKVYTDEGGTYEITTKYNPVENDYFIPASALWAITVNPVRHITVANTSSMPFTVNGNSGHTATIRTGDTIVLEYTMPEFAYFVIKDGNGKEVTLEGVDVTSKEITFTMPDHDLDISVKTPAQIEREEAIANCDHLCHSDNELIRLFWNIICMFFRLLNVQQYCDCGELHYNAPLFDFGA